MGRYTPLYFKWITNKDLLYNEKKKEGGEKVEWGEDIPPC